MQLVGLTTIRPLRSQALCMVLTVEKYGGADSIKRDHHLQPRHTRRQPRTVRKKLLYAHTMSLLTGRALMGIRLNVTVLWS